VLGVLEKTGDAAALVDRALKEAATAAGRAAG
jgi:hypothetical protein